MNKSESTDSIQMIPNHVAIIMDGNGRWAQKRGLPRLAGHRAGTENLRKIIEECINLDIKHLTIYAFSTENWHRPIEEVSGLMGLLENMLDKELESLDKNGVSIRHLGHSFGIHERLMNKIVDAVNTTRNNSTLVLNVAFNYGGRHELVRAVQNIIDDELSSQEVDEELISNYLDTSGQPDPDLVIRTSGEYRISNFLVWQSAYAEWYFTTKLWPDFNEEELYRALVFFSGRERRFGQISDQIK
ncbi:MAG TPA: isoprenyl transferase [Chloroflexi bacterium]|nr:isoprenyl transferase [Chloroflexota bacterium]|tara:strand:+ start:753 stop:1484 length:732 start_codon:yes stop_codon:yes gene_type:complete